MDQNGGIFVRGRWPIVGATALVLLSLLGSVVDAASVSAVRVKGYFRKDGTYVRPHYRSSPDGNPYNNFSYPGNTNPYNESYTNSYTSEAAGGSGYLPSIPSSDAPSPREPEPTLPTPTTTGAPNRHSTGYYVFADADGLRAKGYETKRPYQYFPSYRVVGSYTNKTKATLRVSTAMLKDKGGNTWGSTGLFVPRVLAPGQTGYFTVNPYQVEWDSAQVSLALDRPLLTVHNYPVSDLALFEVGSTYLRQFLVTGKFTNDTDKNIPIMMIDLIFLGADDEPLYHGMAFVHNVAPGTTVDFETNIFSDDVASTVSIKGFAQGYR